MLSNIFISELAVGEKYHLKNVKQNDDSNFVRACTEKLFVLTGLAACKTSLSLIVPSAAQNLQKVV